MPPSATLVATGLPKAGLTPEQLESAVWDAAVKAGSSMPNSVQFEYDEFSSRFLQQAVIEFPHSAAAELVMKYTNGVLLVEKVTLTLAYRHAGGTARSRSRSRGAQRDEPSVTLIVKGLQSSTAEASIIAAFRPFAAVQDIRYFPRRGFAFVQFYSVEDANVALTRFDRESHFKLDGYRVMARFAKEREEGGRFAMERSLLQKQAAASAEASEVLEQLAAQTVQAESASKALTGVNAGMWASYMQSVAQTETVQSANTFSFDKESGFYKDAKARLFYDPSTTYFFTLDYKKYFIYDHEEQMLCLVSPEGKKVENGERRPLPSEKSSAAKPEAKPELAKPFKRSRSRRRSHSRSRQQSDRSPLRPTGREKEQAPGPIFFPGGDPLAKLAPASGPVAPPQPAPKPKQKRKQSEAVLGIVEMPENKSILRGPGRVTVFSNAVQPGPAMVLQPGSEPVARAFAPPPQHGNQTLNAMAELIEWICEICMRRFPSEENLRRHEQLSELHKQNLATLGTDLVT